MPRTLPPLNALRAFEAAGRFQSFSRAAEELSVTHSSVSRHVRGLEDRLGVQLFRDLPRGVELTNVGKSYLHEVTVALDQISEATVTLSERPKGMVSFDMEPLFASHWLIPRLGAFYEKYPEIELRLTAQEALADVGRYEADLALRFFKDDSIERSHDLISNAPVMPFGSSKIFDGPLVDPMQILEHRLYRDRAGPMWQTWMEAAGGDPSAIPDQTWRMRSSLAMESAAAGHGVILMASDIADRLVREGRLVCLSKVGIRRGSYRLVLGPDAQRRKPVRLFRQWLLEVTRSLRTET